MSGRIIVRRRSGGILVLELGLIALIVSYMATHAFKLNWAWGVVIFLASAWAVASLFFNFRIFRYLFSVAFSIGWGMLGYGLTGAIDHKTGHTSSLIMGGLAFLLGLWFHKDEFEFRRDAKVTQIERY